MKHNFFYLVTEQQIVENEMVDPNLKEEFRVPSSFSDRRKVNSFYIF